MTLCQAGSPPAPVAEHGRDEPRVPLCDHLRGDDRVRPTVRGLGSASTQAPPPACVRGDMENVVWTRLRGKSDTTGSRTRGGPTS
jgi:hypothetical protein